MAAPRKVVIVGPQPVQVLEVRLKRVLPREQLPENEAERIDVDPRVRRLPVDLLGRHVRGGAGHVRGLGGPEIGGQVLGAREVEHLGQVSPRRR